MHLANCTMCFEPGTLLRVGVRASAAIDSVPEVTNARALAKAAFTSVTSRAYPMLRVGRGAVVVVWGPAGQGKSSLAGRLVDGIDGPVALQSVEEAPGPALHDRLARCHIRREDFHILGRTSVDGVADFCREKKIVALAIDSLQIAAYTSEELRHLTLVLPDLRVLVAVCQVNKRGSIEGKERVIFEADVAIRCDQMKFVLTKSRYQKLDVSGDVLSFAEGAHDEDN
ncbi:MAG: hypothetical protein ACHREM_15945 [Polyangiales bacterium]